MAINIVLALKTGIVIEIGYKLEAYFVLKIVPRFAKFNKFNQSVKFFWLTIRYSSKNSNRYFIKTKSFFPSMR